LRQYYFTVASLPMLRYNETPGITLDEFSGLCAQWLQHRDLQLVLNAGLNDLGAKDPSSPVLESWQRWETSLRNELVKLRAQKKGMDPQRYLRSYLFMTRMPETVQEAAGMSNPLDSEMHLNRIRWNYLEELEVGHHFDPEKLVIYSLKLQLLERQRAMERRQGEERFHQIYSQIEETFKTGETYHG